MLDFIDFPGNLIQYLIVGSNIERFAVVIAQRSAWLVHSESKLRPPQKPRSGASRSSENADLHVKRCSVDLPLGVVMKQLRGLQIAALLLLARQCFCQYGYNYDANYYDDYSLYTAGRLPRFYAGAVICPTSMSP